MSKEKTNEGLFGTIKKFSDSFFNGLQKTPMISLFKELENWYSKRIN